jgi:hypothetical protein
MDIDRPEEGQGQKNEETCYQVQPENPIEALRVNGTTPNQEESVEPEESQTTVSEHPQEGAVEDVSIRLEKYAQERPMGAGTSSQPPP